MPNSHLYQPIQHRLIEPPQVTVDFSSVYSNPVLAHRLNSLETSLGIVDEQRLFEDHVNTSRSQKKPYHRWARYREGYSDWLVSELIRRSGVNPNKHFTFDPMCGSGSTLVASVQNGYSSLGMDVNPYSVDLTNAKLQHYSANQLAQVVDFIQEAPTTNRSNTSVTWQNIEECQPYFRDDHLASLYEIKVAIETVQDPVAKQLLFVAWLTILEDCSDKKKDGNGLASRPSRVDNVWRYFTKQVERFLEDIRNDALPKGVTASARRQSALECAPLVQQFAEITGKELGTVIFSPPYANSFDYFESYKLELLAGYFNMRELAEARKDTVRNYRKGYRRDLTTTNELVKMLCDEVRTKIPIKEKATGRADNRSRLVPNLLVGYFEDMKKVIKELSLCMPKGSHCHIVVDQSAYLGVIIPTDLLLADIAMQNGYEAVGLSYCRSANTSSQQMAQYPYLKTMLRETIISLRKS